MEIAFTSSFVRQMKRLPKALKLEAIEKLELFQEEPKNKQLKIHKLKGKLKDRWSFSVNYKTRIVFCFREESHIILLAISDHDIYKK